MIKNDFLYPLFSLNPIIVALIVWFWGLGSLVLVGIRTKTIKSIVLKNPGIIIGDFFILPVIAFLITYFYQNVTSPLGIITSAWWSLITAFIALAMTVISAIRFNLMSLWWLPHGVFYLLMTYIILTFLSKAFYQLVFRGDVFLWIIWLFVFIGSITHQLLGIFWSKKFPKP